MPSVMRIHLCLLAVLVIAAVTGYAVATAGNITRARDRYQINIQTLPAQQVLLDFWRKCRDGQCLPRRPQCACEPDPLIPEARFRRASMMIRQLWAINQQHLRIQREHLAKDLGEAGIPQWLPARRLFVAGTDYIAMQTVKLLNQAFPVDPNGGLR